MEHLTIPQMPVLRGEGAINALREYINELENERPEELTEAQTNALIQLAKGLIVSIEAHPEPEESSSQSNLFSNLKRSISGYIHKRNREPAQSISDTHPILKSST